MGKAVVYVTRSGNSRALARQLAAMLGMEAIEIVDKVDRHGFWGYMKAGFQASTRKATPIGDPGVNLSGADVVVMVQPIWASAVVPPLRTWLNAHKDELRGKKLGLFTICKGSDASAVRASFEKEFLPLAAFGGVFEKDDEQTRAAACERFLATLQA